MVAGKFLMYREQAKAIEEQAKSLVKSLKKKKLGESCITSSRFFGALKFFKIKFLCLNFHEILADIDQKITLNVHNYIFVT